MPLLVTDFTWTQTDTTVHVSVPVKGAKPSEVDIVSTDEYLKVHFPPYLFEAFLFEPVYEDRSTAKVRDGIAVFSLPKRSIKMWECLMITTNDKKTKMEIRERALVKYMQKLSLESTQRAEKQQADKKYSLETMMKLEREERDRIQKMKDTEREKTTAELAAWQKQKADQNIHRDTKSKTKQAILPSPRLSGNIQITFTPRVFPTALRESQVAEEEEWLQKQAEVRRVVNTELKDLTVDQRNADWLKDRGDKSYVAGDYVGAVNAYSLAIRLNRKIPALYSNRAACHLKSRNLHKAIEDSSKALDLLTPAVAANAAARIRAFVRRGSAFCQLQLYAEGLKDYEAALKISPQNEALQTDAQRIKDTIQGPTVSPQTQGETNTVQYNSS